MPSSLFTRPRRPERSRLLRGPLAQVRYHAGLVSQRRDVMHDRRGGNPMTRHRHSGNSPTWRASGSCACCSHLDAQASCFCLCALELGLKLSSEPAGFNGQRAVPFNSYAVAPA